MALTGRAAILAAREGGETIKANKIATSVGSVPAKFLTPTVEKAASATAAASATRVPTAAVFYCFRCGEFWSLGE